MTKRFEELGLSAQLIRALSENKFEAPFPIQETAIPLILQGTDVVGQAHTGTGKTAAFGLPILARIKPRGPVQALILAPTRELAVQVTAEINRFARYTGIKTVLRFIAASLGQMGRMYSTFDEDEFPNSPASTRNGFSSTIS